MTEPSIVGFVPARAGSRRIEGKNLRPLGGHPLIAFTIGAALDSGIFESVIVSTDSAQIADVARRYGAEVPFLRPGPMAGEHSPDIEWLGYTMSELAAAGRSWECFSILRPTSPFRQADTIRRAWERFRGRPDADSLRAVERCRQHPMKMWVVEDDLMRPLIPGGPTDPPWHSTPYQSLPPRLRAEREPRDRLEPGRHRAPLDRGLPRDPVLQRGRGGLRHQRPLRSDRRRGDGAQPRGAAAADQGGEPLSVTRLIPTSEFARVRRDVADPYARAELVAAMCRLNTLSAVKRAGSGHLGSSFSAMDIVVWLYLEELDTLRLGVDHPDRDVYFSSKGHDVPGLYAVLNALGVIPDEKLLALRRLGGLEGHPDSRTIGMEASTGSLGMGISKGRGIARARRMLGRGGRVFVMTGDGELQEGQVYEALQATAHQGTPMTVIVDHNKLQSDRRVEEITSLGDLEAKFAAFGWRVARCDGHDPRAIESGLRRCLAGEGPGVLIADTIKGRGVSFMEPRSP